MLRISGYSREEIMGQHPRILQSGGMTKPFTSGCGGSAAGIWLVEGRSGTGARAVKSTRPLLSIAVVKGRTAR